MRALLLRELTIATRRTSFIACVIAHLALLSAFLLVWPAGVPLMHGSVYEQARLIDAVVLAWVLPWAAIRLAAASDADARARLAVLSGAPPSVMALAALLATAAVLAFITLTGLPLLLRAQQMSAEPWTRVARDEIALAGFACAVAAISAAATIVRDRLWRWLLAAAVTMLLAGGTARIVHRSLEAAVGFAGVAVVVALLVVQHARASGRYLVERQP
jgi:hypothetical protein